MTDRAALVEKIDRLIDGGFLDGEYTLKNLIHATIDLIRDETLEEAARVADEAPNGWGPTIAAAIRALKG